MPKFNIDFKHNLPTSALLQFCGARADPYANFVATIMFQDLKLSVRGQRNMNTALSNLPVFYSPDEKLCFGWSYDHFIRSPGIHRGGYEHIGMMGVLNSTFHESYATEVLHAVASEVGDEDDMIPHLRIWRNQLRSIAGCFIPFDFDTLVEDYIRLDPCSIGPGSNLVARRCRVPPKHMAKGLLAISRITSGKEKQIILVGGATIGWFAAVCEWLYDLRTMVLSPDGEYLHGHKSADDAQVILIYNQAPILEVHTGGYKEAIKEAHYLDDRGYDQFLHFLPFGGRVSWQALLPRIFGQAFHHLDHEQSRALNTIIGAAARGLEGAVKTSQDDPMAASNQFSPASYGAGLIQNITAWLPELRRGQARMERQLKRPYEEAAETYHETLASLETICHCQICALNGVDKPPKDGYCLVVVVETIIVIGLAVSQMTVSPGVYPSREGVQGLYTEQVERRMKSKHIDPRSQEYLAVVYGNEWNAPISRRLQNAVALFTGRRPLHHIPETLIAIAHEGICAYSVQLWKAGTSSALRHGAEGLIRIVNGSINVKNKFFLRMSLEPVLPADDAEEDWEWEAMTFEGATRPVYLK